MTDRIEGKVAQIINRRELVMNVGTDHGVQTGMRFAVLYQKGAHVKDPDTGEPIGSVEVPKVLVEVVRVQPKLSVARTFHTTELNVGGRSFNALEIFQPPKWVKKVETLRVADKPYAEELAEEESYVKVGDPIVQVVGDEFLVE